MRQMKLQRILGKMMLEQQGGNQPTWLWEELDCMKWITWHDCLEQQGCVFQENWICLWKSKWKQDWEDKGYLTYWKYTLEQDVNYYACSNLKAIIYSAFLWNQEARTQSSVHISFASFSVITENLYQHWIRRFRNREKRKTCLLCW